MNRFLAKKWPPLLVLGIVTLLLWGHTVMFGFVWDDDYFIRNLQSIRSLRHIPEMFYRQDAQATLPDFMIFRPIRTMHYALLYFLGGKETPQPWIFHLANVLWHGAAGMMLFSVLTLLLPRLNSTLEPMDARFWAFAVAMGFVVHPVVSEVVCWAKSLDDILATFFTLASLRELLLPPENKAARWRGLIFFALAVYSKVSAAPFAIIPFVIFGKIHRLPWKENVLRTIPYFVIAAIYMVHRWLVIGRNSQTTPISGTYGQTLIDMLPIVPKYVRLLLGVPPFHIDYSYLHGGNAFFSPEVLGGLILLLALAVAGFLAWRTPQFATAGFGLFWTGIFLLPVSNLLPMMQYMAERFLYLPLIGWLIALAAVGSTFSRQKSIRAMVFVLLLLWAVTAWNRSWIWHDRVTLFVTSYEQGPKTQALEQNAVAAIIDTPEILSFFSSDGKHHKLLAGEYSNTPADNQILRTLEQTYLLFPTNHDALSYYGVALAASHQPEKAVPLLKSAAELQPKNLDDWLNLAQASLDAGQPSVATAALDQAGRLAGTNAAVLQLRFQLDWDIGDYAAAHEIVSRLNQAAPGGEYAYWLSETERKLNPTNRPASTPTNGFQ